MVTGATVGAGAALTRTCNSAVFPPRAESEIVPTWPGVAEPKALSEITGEPEPEIETPESWRSHTAW